MYPTTIFLYLRCKNKFILYEFTRMVWTSISFYWYICNSKKFFVGWVKSLFCVYSLNINEINLNDLLFSYFKDNLTKLEQHFGIKIWFTWGYSFGRRIRHWYRLVRSVNREGCVLQNRNQVKWFIIYLLFLINHNIFMYKTRMKQV